MFKIRSVGYIVYFLSIVGFGCIFGLGQEKGDQCSFKDATKGICKLITTCPHALESLKKGIFPEKTCGFKGTQSIVCCKEDSYVTPTTVSITTSTLTTSVTTPTPVSTKSTPTPNTGVGTTSQSTTSPNAITQNPTVANRIPGGIKKRSYYWKEWEGFIPDKAFVAGSDARGAAYIAQVHVPKVGIYIGHIFKGDKEVFVNTELYEEKPVISSTYNLKILCSNNTDLYWMISNIDETAQVLKSKGAFVVKGGVSSGENSIYIGKHIHEDNVFIGNVHGDWQNKYYLYYTDPAPLSSWSSFYEILMSRDH